MNPISVDWHLIFCFPTPHRVLRVHFSDTPSVRYLLGWMYNVVWQKLEENVKTETMKHDSVSDSSMKKHQTLQSGDGLVEESNTSS